MRILLITLIFISSQLFAQKAPIIGVSSTAEPGKTATNLTYINSIKKAGGVPIVIPMTSSEEQLERILETIDGLVMTGGEDIDPLKNYGEEPHPKLGTIAPERDAFDHKLLSMAIDKKIPIFAICRGMQMLNIVQGGTLYQDLPDQKGDEYTVLHLQKAPGSYPTHSIDIFDGKIIRSILKDDEMVVNSFHHQAIKDLGKDLKIVAKSKDGVVEAVEGTGDSFIIGVQFHPEVHVSSGRNEFLPLFEALVKQASK